MRFSPPHVKRGRLRARCVQSVGPLIAGLSAELSEKELVNALPVLEKLRRYLDTHRLSA